MDSENIPTYWPPISSAVSWALHALSLNTAAQSKLRQELLTLSAENPTMDELNSLPYLESVGMSVIPLNIISDWPST
jgi:hypothetical protein